jgi:Helix-turn-helix domain
MSVDVLDLVWKRSEHKGSDLLLLLAIADNADEETGIAYPGVAYLAAKTRLSVRGVKYALKRLLDGDELILLERGGRRGKQTRANTYEVQMQTLHKKAVKVQTKASQGAVDCTPTVSKEPSVRTTSSFSSSNNPQSQEVRSVWDYYVAVFGSPKGKGLTPSRERVIRKALAEFSVEELQRAVDGLARYRERKPGNTEIASAFSTGPRTGPLVERIGFWVEQAGTAPADDDLDADQVRREQGLE